MIAIDVDAIEWGEHAPRDLECCIGAALTVSSNEKDFGTISRYLCVAYELVSGSSVSKV